MTRNFKKGELLDIAISIAVTAHKGQYDRGGQPYILHCMKVMHYLKSEDEELQCVALLHDSVEDGGVTYKALRDAGMTERIVEAVRCLTKVPGEEYEEYKAKVKSNPDSRQVKKADLRHNSDIRRLKGVRPKDIERMVKYHQFYLELLEMDGDT